MTERRSTQTHPYLLETAIIEWQEGNVPCAKDYEDIYFSPLDGLQESQYVFLHHNHLHDRWKTLDNTYTTFNIAEIGFGTGLNFLATWHLWNQLQQHRHKTTQLHFISVEKHPLTSDDLTRALSKWPDLKPLSTQLINAYPSLTPGHHLLRFAHNQINLHLLFGDAAQCFEQLQKTSHPLITSDYNPIIDAWFLDGFAPSKNPQLWNDTIFNIVAQLSKKGTTFSTFTAAGHVRRALTQHGFQLEKVPGFKHKREMLRGQFIGHPPSCENVLSKQQIRKQKSKAPWYVLPKSSFNKKQITVIGAGLSGTSSAYALANRGWQVTLIERQANAGLEASGNAQGMLYTKLSPKPEKLNHFSLSSYLYALRFYHHLVANKVLLPSHYDFCGLLQLVNNKELKNFQQLSKMLSEHSTFVRCVDAQEASSISGTPLNSPAYYFPSSGWISPKQLCQQFVKNPNITTLFHNEAITIHQEDTSTPPHSRWTIYDQNQNAIIHTDAIIIANSHDAADFNQSNHLPIKSIRGQVSQIPTSETLAKLKTVICHNGYITPTINQYNSIGATFSLGDNDTALRTKDHFKNIENLHRAIPSLLPEGEHSVHMSDVMGRAALRCTTPDYLPMVGQLPDYSKFLNDYSYLRKDSNWPITTPGNYHPNLYINIGHGSRGLTSTPLCSELLAAMINNEPYPLPRYLVKSLHPARFIIRDLIRRKI